MASVICAEEIAYHELKQRILDGRLSPGTRIVHRVLAKELGVSPNPVVLALRMLERDGLVTNTPGLGARVRQWSREEIVDLYMIRAACEALAARFCAGRANALDLEAIGSACGAFNSAIDTNDAEANIQADMELHAAISRGAHCSDLERMTEGLSVMRCSMRIFGLSLNVPRFLEQSGKHIHDAVVKAISNRDAEAAEIAGRRHVEDSLARNLAWIEDISAAMGDGRSPATVWNRR